MALFRRLQPLGKKKQEAALLATPLPRMTQDAVVAPPASASEKLELDKWIQERKASYPSATNVAAKQAEAARLAPSTTLCHHVAAHAAQWMSPHATRGAE